MRCADAEVLFDAFLDGELSPALATELGAHRLRCASCRRKLALLEVAGQIIASDQEPARLSQGFEDRLLACVEQPKPSFPLWRSRLARIGAPLAAAAVLAMAAFGVFAGRDRGRVAGVVEQAPPAVADVSPSDLDEFTPPTTPRSADELPLDGVTRALENWLERTQHEFGAVQGVFDLTIYQTLDILEEARRLHPPQASVVGGADSAPTAVPSIVPPPKNP
jgi:hypothetical protein